MAASPKRIRDANVVRAEFELTSRADLNLTRDDSRLS
jgi:hypothetical protein